MHLKYIFTWVDGVYVFERGKGDLCQCDKVGEEVEVTVQLVVEASDKKLLLLFAREGPWSLLLHVVNEGKVLEQKVPKPIPNNVFALALKRPVLVNVKVESL